MKLNHSTINELSENVLRYPHPMKSRIMHFGIGGFHRSHQAWYTASLMKKIGCLEWGIAGVGILPTDAKMAMVLEQQDNLYTLIEKPSNGKFNYHVLPVISEYIHGYKTPNEVFKKALDKDLSIISLTVTEGGYNVDAASGEFKSDDKEILHDLSNHTAPKTIFGFLAESLFRRKEQGLAGVTLLSCDNVQYNGSVLKKTLITFLKLRDESLAQWVLENCSFPNSMVDRITPKTTQEDIDLLKRETGIVDQWPVVCESFIQWIIEDNFVNGRPNWEEVGVQFVKDVSLYEQMKLRLLNASHQALAYLGCLHGYQYVDEAAQDTDFQQFMLTYMTKEVEPTIAKPRRN